MSVRGCGCLALIAIALMVGGGQALYTVLTNREPVRMTVAEYVQSGTDKKWLELKGAQIGIIEGVYFALLESSTPKEIFVPVTNSTNANDETTILLATKNPTLLAQYAKLSEFEELSEGEALAALIERREEFMPTMDVSGLIRFGIDLDSDDTRKLRDAFGNLSQDFIILDHESKPSWLMALLLIPGMLVIVIMVFAFINRNEDEEKAPEPPASS